MLPVWVKWHPVTARKAEKAANWTIRRTQRWEEPSAEEAEQHQVVLLRDLLGNPYQPVAVDPAWMTPTVRALAQAIHKERAFDRLPILADALEDAGCTDAEILSHLRGPGPHVRGCWALDLILGK